MVEFALVLPIFLLLTFGTIELGWLIFTNHSLANATREGARFAMVHGQMSGNVATAESVGVVVTQRTARLSGPINTTVVFSPNAEPGSQVTVATSYNYRPIIAMVLGVGSITLNNSSTVIVQY